MTVNQYSTMTERLATELATLSATYASLVVTRMQFRPAKLPDFTRYAIVVSPPGRPWEERRVGVPSVHYIFNADLFLLVKNWHETDALYGTTAGSLGLFQFIWDVKVLLRLSNLSGLLYKTYDEPAGQNRPVSFQEIAATGFDSGEHSFVYRALIPYQAQLEPFCHPRL